MWGQSQVGRCASTALSLSCILLSIGNYCLVESATVPEKDLAEGKDSLGNYYNGEIKRITNLKRRTPRQEVDLTLVSFLQKSVKKYGEKKVATSIHELAQNSLYNLVWYLAGDLEPWLIYDLYKLYNTASADSRVLFVYEKFRAGQVNRSIVPEVFALDKKYNEHTWYRRVRSRLLENVDKYMAGSLLVTNPPPKIEFGPDGKPIIEGQPETEIAAVVAKASTTRRPPGVGDTTDEDPDDPDNSDLDLEDLFENFID